MISTGIVLRIDQLGRIAIPKEIRQRMKIQDFDALEIFIDTKNNGITFVPYESITFTQRINEIKNDIQDERYLYGNIDAETCTKINKYFNEILNELEGK